MARIRRETYRDGQVTVDEVEIPDEVIHEQTLNSRADTVLVDLRALVNTSGTLTGAQLSSAVRLLARVMLTIARLHWRRLDGTD